MPVSYTHLDVYKRQEIVIAQAIWVVACIFDISWFFFGTEKFKVTVIRNTVIKLLTVIAIFLFVRTAEDLWKYVDVYKRQTSSCECTCKFRL